MKNNKIYERRDGRYEMRLTVDGKRLSVYGSTKTEVMAKFKRLRQEVLNKKIKGTSDSLADSMERYIYGNKRTSIKASSFDRVESTFITHILSSNLAKKPYNRITPEEIQDLLNSKHDAGLSVSSTNKIYDLFNEFYRYHSVNQNIQFNPMLLVKKPRENEDEDVDSDCDDFSNIEVFTVEEARTIVSIAESVNKTGEKNYRYGEAIVLLLHTGLRNGELRALKLDSVDLKNRKLYVNRTVVRVKNRKTGKREYKITKPKSKKGTRAIPLNSRAIEAIKILIETTYNKETGFLVTSENGNILSHALLQRAFDRILKVGRLEHKGLHSTRHTFATILLKNAVKNGQIKEVSEMLGHCNVWVTYQYYIATNEEQKKGLVDLLDSLLE